MAGLEFARPFLCAFGGGKPALEVRNAIIAKKHHFLYTKVHWFGVLLAEKDLSMTGCVKW